MRAGFTSETIETDDTRIFVCWAGMGPPLLLLHGFPQTHLMWREVAPRLAHRFTVICPDLRGYGRSGCPVSRPDHAPYAKRAIAQDLVFVMEKLGFETFSVAGHDRGARGPTASPLTTPGGWNVSPFSTSFRPPRSGSGPTNGLPAHTGRGHC
jgi:haloacetate dehalogenase